MCVHSFLDTLAGKLTKGPRLWQSQHYEALRGGLPAKSLAEAELPLSACRVNPPWPSRVTFLRPSDSQDKAHVDTPLLSAVVPSLARFSELRWHSCQMKQGRYKKKLIMHFPTSKHNLDQTFNLSETYEPLTSLTQTCRWQSISTLT